MGICRALGNDFKKLPDGPLIVKEKLENNFEVIEDGMCDRTGFVFNPKGEKFSSLNYLPKLLKKLNFSGIIIFAVGTNDLQFQYNISDEI